VQVIGGGDAGEDGLAVVGDLAGLAVHQLGGADDVAAEGRADGLVAEADAEDGDARAAACWLAAKCWIRAMRCRRPAGCRGRAR
jgi:hypothetical protein